MPAARRLNHVDRLVRVGRLLETAADFLRQRATIKRQTIEHLRLQHRKIAA